MTRNVSRKVIGEKQNIPEDECPIWNTNEYHVEEDKICELLDMLKDVLKITWYIHAFNEEKLYVVLSGKAFSGVNSIAYIKVNYVSRRYQKVLQQQA